MRTRQNSLLPAETLLLTEPAAGLERCADKANFWNNCCTTGRNILTKESNSVQKLDREVEMPTCTRSEPPPLRNIAMMSAEISLGQR